MFAGLMPSLFSRRRWGDPGDRCAAVVQQDFGSAPVPARGGRGRRLRPGLRVGVSRQEGSAACLPGDERSHAGGVYVCLAGSRRTRGFGQESLGLVQKGLDIEPDQGGDAEGFISCDVHLPRIAGGSHAVEEDPEGARVERRAGNRDRDRPPPHKRRCAGRGSAWPATSLAAA